MVQAMEAVKAGPGCRTCHLALPPPPGTTLPWSCISPMQAQGYRGPESQAVAGWLHTRATDVETVQCTHPTAQPRSQQHGGPCGGNPDSLFILFQVSTDNHCRLTVCQVLSRARSSFFSHSPRNMILFHIYRLGN